MKNRYDIYRELELVFSTYYGNKWENLPKKQKSEMINRLADIITKPEKNLQMHYLDLETQDHKSKYWDIKLLLLGIILGITGNLVANVLDRYFAKFGRAYDGIILVALLVTFFLAYNFILQSGKNIIARPIAKELLDI